MRILITGGAGTLGVPLANRLAAEGHTVHVLDDLSAGDPEQLATDVTLRRGDVRDVPRLWSLLAGVDVVYHLAARVSVQESVLFPVEYNAVNTGGTVAVMAAARDAGVRRVVFSSSGTVYGEQDVQPIRESAPPRPANPYAVSKLAAEHYVRAIGELYRIETICLRIFNAYGSSGALQSSHPPVIPHMIASVLRGESVVVHGEPAGSQTRDFVHVDDVVRAMVRAGTLGGISGRTFNIGSGVETSIDELVIEVERATERRAKVIHSPEQSGGVARMCADIGAAASGLDWRPRVELREGLRKTVDAIRRRGATGRTPPAGQVERA